MTRARNNQDPNVVTRASMKADLTRLICLFLGHRSGLAKRVIGIEVRICSRCGRTLP